MPTLNWIGKEAVVNHHRHVPYRLLHCDKSRSAGDPDSGNLLVQGDNLEALKALLPYYAGKVKCIYIDPPYNTGNENWIYNDNVNSPQIKKWLGQVVGKEAEDLTRHDKWLCMMYPRLALLREFLSEDGAIFVSIDENEHRFLLLMMDELFGGTNKVETLIWKKSYGGGSKSNYVVNVHEYVHCFAKNLAQFPNIELPPNEAALSYYKLKDSKLETRGPHRLQPLATNSMDERPNLKYAILYEGEEIWPEKQWQWSKDRVLQALANDDLVIKRTRGRLSVSYKQYLRDDEGNTRSSKAYSIIDGIYTQQGTNELKEMFGDGKTFSFPKPSGLIAHLLGFIGDSTALILDSFAGSGTTGHAVLQMNKADGGNRRFICIEMDETIARDVTAQRLRKVVEGYTNAKGDAIEPLGGGFRFCTLGKPLFDEYGSIDCEVKYNDLAAHVFFSETGSPLPKRTNGQSPLLGIFEGRAVYLLFNGILGDKKPNGGNVLTGAVLESLPEHDGPKVIYGEACRLGRDRLQAANVTFKQVPWEVRVG